MNIEIDPNSGFCFGVVYAIRKAEEELRRTGKLYCLGDIVHNNLEVERLKSLGLITIDHETFRTLKDSVVLIRAHGEPPETYQTAKGNNIRLIDATCPVVLRLQHKIKLGFESDSNGETQTVIYGRSGHAEVNGLVGQTGGKAIVINHEGDLDQIDFSKPVALFSQTTQSTSGFREIVDEIQRRMKHANPGSETELVAHDTICRQVSSRSQELEVFSRNHPVIIFVSGIKSSNGKILYDVCKKANPKTYLVSEPGELNPEWFKGAESAGICGATSTPRWLMEEIAGKIKQIAK